MDTPDWAPAALGLEYRWVGAASSRQAPVVVFLHEALGSVSQWKGFPERLCHALGCRGLVYSRAGHGQSVDRAPPDYEFDFLERAARVELPALLGALGVDEQYVLFGHSDGASIALLHAAAFPERVRAAVVLAPHIFVEPMTADGVHAAMNTWRTTDLPERLQRHHRSARAVFERWHRRWTDPPFAAWNIEAELSRIECPVLAIQGEGDEYASMAQIDGIAARVAGCQILKLAHCGHSPHRDSPEQVITATRQFVEHLLASSP